MDDSTKEISRELSLIWMSGRYRLMEPSSWTVCIIPGAHCVSLFPQDKDIEMLYGRFEMCSCDSGIYIATRDKTEQNINSIYA